MGNFSINEDGSIQFGDRTKSAPVAGRSKLDEELVDIIKTNSYSSGLFAAYKGRKLAEKICKEKSNKANYKEYVEMLIKQNYPAELEKSRLGKKVMTGIHTIWISLVGIILSILLMFNGYLWKLSCSCLIVFLIGVIVGVCILRLELPKLKKCFQ